MGLAFAHREPHHSNPLDHRHNIPSKIPTLGQNGDGFDQNCAVFYASGGALFECGTIKGPVCVTLKHYTTTQALQCTKEAKDPEKTGREGNATNFHLHTHTHTRNQNKLKSSDTKTIWHRYVTKLHDTLVPMTSSYNEIMNILRD